MDYKAFFKSKTFWYGVVSLLLGILNYIDGYFNNGTALTLNGFIVILLRWISTQPISFNDKQR
jgi:hypothetical protein